MRKFILILIIPFLAEAKEVRIRIAEDVPKATIRGLDLQFFEGTKKDLKQVVTTHLKSEWAFRCQDGKIRGVRVDSKKKEPILEFQEPLAIKTPAGVLNYENRPYREEIRIYSNGILCEVVNHLDIEKYLDGLVNSEFSAKWNEQSIGAQIIAARTYAAYQIEEVQKKKGTHFDLDSTTKDQVYDGFVKEDFHSSRMVEQTRGWVLTTGTDRRPKILKAFYHSTCGGKTELPENVWGKKLPGLNRSVACPYCVTSPRFNWTLELDTQELISIITHGLKKEDLFGVDTVKEGKLLDMRIKSSSESGRALQILTLWSKDGEPTPILIPGAKLREWIGPTRMRSTWFRVSFHGLGPQGKWKFEGKGNGHGVGMCQWGAKVMGEQKFPTAAILQYYYPEAILRKLW